jgi:hypothetical protein
MDIFMKEIMKNKREKLLLTLSMSLLIISLFALSACSSNTLTPEAEKQPTEEVINTEISNAYPESEVPLVEVTGDTGYPIDEAEIKDYYEEYPLSVEIQTPTSDKGVVTGRLVTSANQEPYLAPALYLGNYLQPEEDREDIPQAISIATETDPKAIQAQDGTFVFSNVEPGEYALFIWTPMSLILVSDLDNFQGEKIIIVTAGEILDLGTINID